MGIASKIAVLTDDQIDSGLRVWAADSRSFVPCGRSPGNPLKHDCDVSQQQLFLIMATSIRSTVFDVLKWRKPSVAPSLSRVDEPSQGTVESNSNESEAQNDEYKLPKMASLVIVLLTSTLLQVRDVCPD